VGIKDLRNICLRAGPPPFSFVKTKREKVNEKMSISTYNCGNCDFADDCQELSQFLAKNEYNVPPQHWCWGHSHWIEAKPKPESEIDDQPANTTFLRHSHNF